MKSLDRAALITGLQVMADKYPRQFHDFLIENDDAETGDIASRMPPFWGSDFRIDVLLDFSAAHGMIE